MAEHKIFSRMFTCFECIVEYFKIERNHDIYIPIYFERMQLALDMRVTSWASLITWHKTNSMRVCFPTLYIKKRGSFQTSSWRFVYLLLEWLMSICWKEMYASACKVIKILTLFCIYDITFTHRMKIKKWVEWGAILRRRTVSLRFLRLWPSPSKVKHCFK